MKNKFRFLQILLPVLLVFSACQEDIVNYNDGYDAGIKPAGKPEITKIIMATDTAQNAEEIVTAPMAYMIAIYGKNLGSPISIKFNDVEVDMKTVYAVNSRITLPIPRQFPNEIDNKLTIVNSFGNVVTEFEVTVPPLKVQGLENEFMNAGDEVKLLGANFDLYDINKETGELTVDGNPVEIIEATADYITFVIPEGTADGAIITVNSAMVAERGYAPQEASFREWGNALVDYSNNWGSDGAACITDGTHAGDPVAPVGITQYFRIAQDLGGWQGFVPYGGGHNLDSQDIVDNPENYCVKVEVFTKKQLSVGNIHFEHANSGKDRWQWNPAEGGIALNTNSKWKTLTFDNVSDFFATGNPEKWKTGWLDFSFVYQPATSDDTKPDFCLANFRIAKKYNN
jgi:hypothetical protein